MYFLTQWNEEYRFLLSPRSYFSLHIPFHDKVLTIAHLLLLGLSILLHDGLGFDLWHGVIFVEHLGGVPSPDLLPAVGPDMIHCEREGDPRLKNNIY
jgi:hypothetical protein